MTIPTPSFGRSKTRDEIASSLYTPTKDATFSKAQIKLISDFFTSPELLKKGETLATANKINAKDLAKELKEFIEFDGSTGWVRMVKKFIRFFIPSKTIGINELMEKVTAFKAAKLHQNDMTGSTNPEEAFAAQLINQKNLMGKRVNIARLAEKTLQGLDTLVDEDLETLQTSYASQSSSKLEALKEKQVSELIKLRRCAKENNWAPLQSHSHCDPFDPSFSIDSISLNYEDFDCWMFPTDKKDLIYYTTYQLSPQDIASLKKDPIFMKNYREGMILIARSWGWDLKTGKPIENPHKDQKWTKFSEGRLINMFKSLYLFDQADLIDQLEVFLKDDILSPRQRELLLALRLPTLTTPNNAPVTISSITLLKEHQKECLDSYISSSRQNYWGALQLPTTRAQNNPDQYCFPLDHHPENTYVYLLKSEFISKLKQDTEFMDRYRACASLVARAWGWDLQNKKPVKHPIEGQEWKPYSESRLRNMAYSLTLFGEAELLDSLKAFAKHQKLKLDPLTQKALKGKTLKGRTSTSIPNPQLTQKTIELWGAYPPGSE